MKGGKKMVTIILAVAILAYAGWAIYKIRMKKKNGGCCNGSCGRDVYKRQVSAVDMCKKFYEGGRR